MATELIAGDHVWVDCGAYKHHGIATGPKTIIHYLGKKGVYVDGNIAETGLTKFSDGAPIRVRRHPKRLHDRTASVARARERLGETKYNLLFNNCEHFVQWCIEGRKESDQVQDAAVVATSAVVSTPITLALAVAGGPLALVLGKLPLKAWMIYKALKDR